MSRWQYSSNRSTDSTQSLSKFQLVLFFFCRNCTTNPKIHVEMQGRYPEYLKQFLWKMNNTGKLPFPDLKIDYIANLIKTVWSGTKSDSKTNEADYSKHCLYGQMIFDKCQDHSVEKEQRFFYKQCWENCRTINLILILHHIWNNGSKTIKHKT